MIGALLLLATATPFALTSCDNEHVKVNIELKSDYTVLANAMKDNNKTLVEKLGMIEEAIREGFANEATALGLIKDAVNAIDGTAQEKLEAIKTAITTQTTSFETKLGAIEAAISGGFADDKDALGLIETAINTLNGTNEQKLAAIEEAIKGQNTGIETKLGLIQTALETGLADNKTAIGELKTAIESLKGSVEGLNLNDRIDNIVASLDGIKGAINTDIAALLQGIIDSIDGIQDYSEILTAIKTAIENIEINAGGGETPDPDAYDAGAPAQAVDLGLPSGIKWASYNLGASKPEEYGDYFAWGETKPYYTEGHAQDNPCTSWREGKEAGYKWDSNFDIDLETNNLITYAYDKDTELKPAHDAAIVNWGGTWRMPTKAEQDELRAECNWEWVEVNGVKGCKVSSKSNSNYIFLPAAGCRGGAGFDSVAGSRGFYWSSSLINSYDSASLLFDSDGVTYWGRTRFEGVPIRAVCP